MTKTPSASKVESRLAAIPSTANRGQAQAYIHEASNRVKPQTLLSVLDPLVALGRHLGPRPWSQATRADLVAAISGHRFHKGAHNSTKAVADKPLAASTRYQWRIHLRGFYMWLLEADETPKMFRTLPFEKQEATEERAKELALEPKEVRQLLSGAQNARDRALVLVLIEGGFRASEAAALRLDHMEKRRGGYWLRLPKDEPLLKTGVRKVAVPIIAAARELEAWLVVHPRRHEARAPLFVTLSNRGQGRRMTGPAIGDAVVRCARRAGIRHVHAHMLRHTSATLKIAKGFPPEAIRLVHGWTPKSTMLGYYTHALPHFERMILQAHGLPNDEPELLDLLGSVSCALCSHPNRVTDAECKGCGTRLADAAQESERQHRDGLLLDHVALDAARALGDRLYMAVAASLGWKVPA